MEFWVFCVLGALALDIRNLICEWRVWSWGGTEINALFENELFREGFALPRDTRELVTVFLEFSPLPPPPPPRGRGRRGRPVVTVLELLKFEVLRSNVTLLRDTLQAVTVFLEFPPLRGVTES